MNIHVENGLPYVTVTLTHRGQDFVFSHVLLDTGSAGSIFPTDAVLAIGLHFEALDGVHRMKGIGGGTEFVFSKAVDRVSLGNLHAENFKIEVGAMNYGWNIEGILGFDFLQQAKPCINLAKLEVQPCDD